VHASRDFSPLWRWSLCTTLRLSISLTRHRPLSVCAQDNRLFATLAEGGQPSSSLPPFIFEAGDAAVKAFLAVMQMNLDTAGDGTPSIKRVMDNVNMYVVEQPMTSEAVKKAAVKLVKDGLETLQLKFPDAEDVRWRIMESASAVTAFMRRAASTDAHKDAVDDFDDDSFQMEGEDMIQESRQGEGSGAGPAVVAGGTSVPNGSQCRENNTAHVGAFISGGLGAFDIIGESKESKPRPVCPRGDPVTRVEWEQYAHADGTFAREAELRERIFRGGLAPDVRADGWKLLLGYRPATGQSLEEYAQQKSEAYEVMKRQWVSVTEVQYANHAAFRERVERVAKDVSRTDRETEYFQDAGPHLEALGAILCTWCMYNFDQGCVGLFRPVIIWPVPPPRRLPPPRAPALCTLPLAVFSRLTTVQKSGIYRGIVYATVGTPMRRHSL
jgi:hypothetical protein